VSAQVKWRLAGSGTSEAAAYWNTSSASLAKSKDDATGVTFSGAWDTTTATSDATVDADPGTAGIQPTALSPRVPTGLDVQGCLTYTGTTTRVECTWSDTASRVTVTRVPHAFGDGFPTSEAGPGQVALFTGEFNTSVTDVQVPGYAGSLSLSRSHSTYGNDPAAAIPPAQRVFGPGWTGSLDGSDAGLAGLTVYDGTHLDGTLAFVDQDGEAMIFAPDIAAPRRTGTALTATSSTISWVALDEPTLEAGTGLTVSGTGTSTTLKLVEEDGTVTTFTAAGGAPTTGQAGVFRPTGVSVPGVGATRYDYDTAGRVTRILAPTPPGLTGAGGSTGPAACPPGGEVPGCRALLVNYGTSTATTGTGDVAGQVASVELKIYNPDAGLAVTSCAGTTSTLPAGMVTVPVACYRYDRATKRLASVADPRSTDPATGAMPGTSYEYGTNNQLTRLTPAGLAPYTMTYTSLESRLKLTAVTRTAPTTVVGGGAGTAAQLVRVTYGAPLSGPGLPDARAASVARWGQDRYPTYAAAVFGPDYGGTVPTSGAGSGVDWSYADFSYTDPAGYTLNTAGYGAGQWLYTRTDYDDGGRVVFTLDAPAIAAILDPDGPAAGAGPDFDYSAWGTSTVYNPDTTGLSTPPAGLPANTPAGAVVTDLLEPARYAVLPDGSQALVRPHTHTDNDQDAPNSGKDPATGIGYALPTTVTVTADPTEYGAATTAGPVISRTFTGYSDTSGSATSTTSGWALRAPTTTTTDMNLTDHPGAATGGRPVPMPGDLTTRTFHDEAGRTIEARQPASSGTDAGTTRTIYYTAGANPQDPACGSRPAWAGLVCKSGPAADPTVPDGAIPAAGAATLPTSHTTGYSYLLAPTRAVETSGAVTRTSSTSYDTAGRTLEASTVVTGLTGPAGSATAASLPVDATSHAYDPVTGALTSVTRRAGTATTGTLSTSYDTWGRAISSTGSGPSGASSSTGYDAAGRVVTVTDLKSITRYSYDGTVTSDPDGRTTLERRGLVTKATVTRTGLAETPANLLTYTGAYDPAGQLTYQTMPGGLTQSLTYDLAGQQTGLAYGGQVTAYTTSIDPDTGDTTYTPGKVGHGTWLAWSLEHDPHGRIARQYTGPAAGWDGLDGVTDPADPNAPRIGQPLASDLRYAYDQAGRLTTVTDRTSTTVGTVPAPGDEPTPAIPCTVRAYTFDGNGNRTGHTSSGHPDGDCAGTPTSTSTLTYHYDSADRPTTAGLDGAGTPATYTYDPLGRQTRLPAADAPDPEGGDILLSYYDNDLPATITQGTGSSSVSTTYTLDVADRRAVATTTRGDGTSTVTTRVYTDASDNPAWTETTTTPAPGTGSEPSTSLTRHTGSLTADLAAHLSQDGTATVTLGDPHGDIVTTVTLPADHTETTPAVTINGWADYTEYGSPAPGTDPTTQTGVAGTIGYGWLGTKHRATTPEAAGLTLMGVRLYNPIRGQFTSLDPVPGGNTTPYTYPQDPINKFDLDGKWGWIKSAWNGVKSGAKWAWDNRGTIATVAVGAACVAVSGGICLGAGLVAAGIGAQQKAGCISCTRFAKNFAINASFSIGGFGIGRAVQSAAISARGIKPYAQGVRISARRSIQAKTLAFRAVPKYRYQKSFFEYKFNAQVSLGSGLGNHRATRRWG
jgi:RHS repeat-associated protein